jgi:hypothetical protein
MQKTTRTAPRRLAGAGPRGVLRVEALLLGLFVLVIL